MAHRKTRRPTPDLEALERFAALGDRRSSPFFAGRRAEMETVERLCAEALAVARQGKAMEGATLLFQGAPGAGKTALFSEMSRRWARGETVRGGAAPIAVAVFPGDLADESVVAAEIARAVDPETERAWRETETRDIAGQAGIPGLGRVGGSRRTATAPPVPSLGELCRRFPPSSWVRPICLTVDEVQTVREAATDVLVKLHGGMAGLPVVPVLAGLGNAQDAVAECGLSRLESEAVCNMGALAPGEAREAVETMFGTCHVDCSGAWENWPERLAERSEGWPQHLHNAMRALAAELVRAEGRLAGVEAGTVLERESAYRQRAYRARIGPEMDRARRLVAAVFATLPEEGAYGDRIEGEIEWRIDLDRQERPSGRIPAWPVPDDMTPGQLFDRLVRSGALQRREDGRYSCPIPSFRRFLIDYGAESG